MASKQYYQMRMYLPYLKEDSSPVFLNHAEHDAYAVKVAEQLAQLTRGANVIYISSGIWFDEKGKKQENPCFLVSCNYLFTEEIKNKLLKIIFSVKEGNGQKWLTVENNPIDFVLI